MSTLSNAQMPHETPAQKAARLKWFKEARFGMFIHWGLYAIPAGKWGDKTGHGEWIRETAQIPIPEYEKFQSQFNPVKFNAEEWVGMAKAAGMKYVTITTKHHDGFCLFDSKYTTWDVMNTPFKRDIMKEMAAASHKLGITQCWYHSIMDWHHPDYLPKRSWEHMDTSQANFPRFVDYLHNQVTELLSNYGPIGVMWFDGEWESTWNHQLGAPLYDLCRKVQPNVIVNNRVDVGRGGMGGMSDAGFAGDYGTPEQEVPATGIPGVDWETCMTMNDHWGYNALDIDYKSTKELIRTLVDVVSKGGNFLLNVGPMSSGEFPPLAKSRLKDIGAWMKVNSDSIYGTEASPFRSLSWGRSTQKKGKLYLQVFDWPKDGKLVVSNFGNKVHSARILATNQAVKASKSGFDTILQLPACPDKNCTVIELKISGKPVIYEPAEIETPSATFVTKTSAVLKVSSPALTARYTLDGSTPTAKSAAYTKPIEISKSCVLKSIVFEGAKPMSSIATSVFKKVAPKPAVILPPGAIQGLSVWRYSGSWDKLPDFASLKPVSIEPRIQVGLDPATRGEHIGLVFDGFVNVAETDMIQFSLLSDDGSCLWIDGQLCIDNDGLHSPTEKFGSVALAKGWHRIKVGWFNATGGAELSLRMGALGRPLKAIDPKKFFSVGLDD